MFYICSACGKSAGEVLEPAYSDYVQDLPATGYNSAGKLVWQPTFSDFDPSSVFLFGCCSEYPFEDDGGRAFVLSSENGVCGQFFGDVSNLSGLSPNCKIKVPISGHYQQIESIYAIGGETGNIYYKKEHVQSSKYIESGELFRWTYHDFPRVSGIGPVTFYFYFPVFEILPALLSSTTNTYTATTRPTSITGGNYGIVGDDNKITKVEDSSTIVNETNNTYYNPATGTTVPIVDWSYDYSDRSYTVTTESGDTATITYGDENISITETNTVSGDTVTNNYTIYYLVDGSGEAPADCPHDWQKSDTTVPTCTLPGTLTYTCSLCSQTKTESIPALGHDWQVKQTVTTQYDDTGQLTQQGYTIFECSRCHEQYKSEDGALPPGGGSGTDPGGEEGETIWDKLARLISAIGSGVISVIEGVLGKLLDALIALAGMLVEKLRTVVDAVLRIFDEIPKLFGGFLDFLAALFPYLPPELMSILTFGVIAVVFIGIIKAVRR